MKALLYALMVVLTPLILLAQPDTLWTRILSDLHPGEPMDVQPSFDGGLVWTGSWITGGDSMHTHADLIAQETDGSGNQRWTLHVEGVTDDTIWYGTSVCRTTDSCYLVLGQRHYNGFSDNVLFKLNRQGDLLWRRDRPFSRADLGRSIAPLVNDTYALCTTTTMHDTSGYDYHTNTLAKLNANGDTLWTYSYPGNPVRAVPVTGGCIMIGKTTFPLLAKVDDDGHEVWLREYYDIAVEDFADLVETPNGYFVAGGAWAYGSDNVSLLQVGFDGEPVTIRQFIPDNGRDERVVRMVRTTDSGLMIGGYALSTEDFSEPMMLIKTDSLGARQWRTFTGLAWQTVATAFCALPDGGYAFGGMAYDPGGGFGYGFLARYGAIPNAATGHPVLPSRFALAQNYPNPFNPTTEIAFDLPRTGMATLIVYDILGREVATLADGVIASGRHTIAFDGKSLASGVYFYTLSSAGVSQTKKMLMMK